MRRRLFCLFIALFLLFACSQPVFAEEYNCDKKGSISVTLTDPKDNTPVEGAELAVYYVATVVMDDGGALIYDYTDDYKTVNAKITDSDLARELDGFVKDKNLSAVKIKTNAEGKAFCNELPLGLYFVKQVESVDTAVTLTPFIVTVPSETEGDYVYDINASPKTEVIRHISITIKKVWNTSQSSNAADSVTVQLLKDGNVIETAVLSAENNWEITYHDLPASDAYSVKEIDIPKGFTATYKQQDNVFTVTNTSTLIQTGQLIWPIPVLAICGLLLIAAGAELLQKKRKRNA